MSLMKILFAVVSLHMALGLRVEPHDHTTGGILDGGKALNAAKSLHAALYEKVVKPITDSSPAKYLQKTLGKAPPLVESFAAQNFSSTERGPLPPGFADWRDIPRAVLNAEQQENLKKDPDVIQCPYTCDPTFCSNQPEGDTHCFKYAEGMKVKTCEKYADNDLRMCPTGSYRCSKSLVTQLEKLDSQDMLQNHTISVRGWNVHPCIQVFGVRGDESCGGIPLRQVKLMIEFGNGIFDPSTIRRVPEIVQLNDNEQIAHFRDARFITPGNMNICGIDYSLSSSGARMYSEV